MRKSTLWITAVALLLALGGTACKQGGNASVKETSAPQQTPMLPTSPGALPAQSGTPNRAAGVTWIVPTDWENGPQHQMRVATYRVRAIAGDPEDAECAVYYFGSGQGGTVEANLDRWGQQFVSAGGQAVTPKIEKRKVGNFQVSTIAASGTYLGSGMMSTQGGDTQKPNFRMLGAIVEAPEGLVFFKLTGPINTVAAAQNAFNSLIESIRPGPTT